MIRLSQATQTSNCLLSMKNAPFSSLTLSCLPERREEKKLSPAERSVSGAVTNVSFVWRERWGRGGMRYIHTVHTFFC